MDKERKEEGDICKETDKERKKAERVGAGPSADEKVFPASQQVRQRRPGF